MNASIPALAQRFRAFLPVVVDVETGGFDPKRDALLEIAAVFLRLDENGRLHRANTRAWHVTPFPGGRLNPASLSYTGIDPYHPFREASPEKETLESLFQEVRREVRDAACKRAILVGHNAAFDLAFINAAAKRCGIRRNPFHPFSTFDTVTLAGVAYGQTVLARAVEAAGLAWDNNEAHSAVYDAGCTAELFCTIVNSWPTAHRPAPADR
ncbi:MAG TPA: ribonuclease T [Gammaproteobacteria bacterium]|nr:ribonuclease T [Gammaproteobacteria bacterium]